MVPITKGLLYFKVIFKLLIVDSNVVKSIITSDFSNIGLGSSVNIKSILRDIKKKFGRYTEIREELDKLINEDLIDNLLDKRNRAAHADTSGRRIEFDRSELENMVSGLRTVLFHLVNIAENVRKIENN